MKIKVIKSENRNGRRTTEHRGPAGQLFHDPQLGGSRNRSSNGSRQTFQHLTIH